MHSKAYSASHSKRETILRNNKNKNLILKSSKKSHEIIEEIDVSINTSVFPILLNCLESSEYKKHDLLLSYSESLLSSKKKTEYQSFFMNTKMLDYLLEAIKRNIYPFVQYKVLLILESLLEEKSRFHNIFLNKVDIQHFLSFLKSSDPFLKKHALIIIHYIINGSPESHDILSNFGLVNYLIVNIREKDENFPLAITTLGNILAAGMVDRIYIKEGLPSLCRSLSEDSKGQILGFLRRIINKSDREYIEIFRQCGIIPILIKLFRHGANSSSLQLSHVVKIMGHIFQENENDVIEFLETPDALESINELLQSELELKKRLGFWLLVKVLTTHSIDYLFISPQVLVTVFQISQKGNWKMQKNASLIFAKIFQLASEEHMRFILEKYGERVVYSILPLLDITLPDLVEQEMIQALEAIIRIFEFNENIDASFDSAFIQEIQNTFEILQNSQNHEIRSLNDKILQKISTMELS